MVEARGSLEEPQTHKPQIRQAANSSVKSDQQQRNETAVGSLKQQRGWRSQVGWVGLGAGPAALLQCCDCEPSILPQSCGNLGACQHFFSAANYQPPSCCPAQVAAFSKGGPRWPKAQDPDDPDDPDRRTKPTQSPCSKITRAGQAACEEPDSIRRLH